MKRSLISEFHNSGYQIHHRYGICKKEIEQNVYTFQLDPDLSRQSCSKILFVNSQRFEFVIETLTNDSPIGFDVSLYLKQENGEMLSFNKITSRLVLKNTEILYSTIHKEAMQLHFMKRSAYIDGRYIKAPLPPENLLKNRNDPDAVYWPKSEATAPFWVTERQNEEIHELTDRYFICEMKLEAFTVKIKIESWKAMDISFNQFISSNIARGDVFNGESTIENIILKNMGFVIFSHEVRINEQTYKITKWAMDGYSYATLQDGKLELHGRFRKEAPAYCIVYSIECGDKMEYLARDDNGRWPF